MRALAWIALLLAGGDGTEARSEFLRRIDARPLPDLATLPARARDRAEGSFEDILKLREAGSKEAVPALVEILRGYRGTSYIHGHAAAQALFRIGGESQAAIREACDADPGWWRLAADYSFHWEMAAPDRDRFLEQHVLRSTSTALEARIAADRATVRAGEAVTLTLTLENKGAATAAIWIHGDGVEADLFLRRPGGRFVGLRRFGTTCLEPQHGWVVLEPSIAREFSFKRTFLPCKPRSTPTNDVRAEFAVESEDGRGGRFEVIAVFSRAGAPRLPPEPPAPPWTGRVVCASLPLTIGD